MRRKLLTDAECGYSDLVLVRRDFKARFRFGQLDGAQRSHRIHSRGRQEEHTVSMTPGEVQAIETTHQVRLDNVIRIAVHAGLHARFGGCLD